MRAVEHLARQNAWSAIYRDSQFLTIPSAWPKVFSIAGTVNECCGFDLQKLEYRYRQLQRRDAVPIL